MHTINVLPILESKACYRFNLNPPDNTTTSAYDQSSQTVRTMGKQKEKNNEWKEENGATDEEKHADSFICKRWETLPLGKRGQTH